MKLVVNGYGPEATNRINFCWVKIAWEIYLLASLWTEKNWIRNYSKWVPSSSWGLSFSLLFLFSRLLYINYVLSFCIRFVFINFLLVFYRLFCSCLDGNITTTFLQRRQTKVMFLFSDFNNCNVNEKVSSFR